MYHIGSPQAYGENHLLTARLLLNMGMAYDRQYQEDVAFDCYYRLLDVCMATFGPGHPKTQRAERMLQEQPYARMLRDKKATAAGQA